MTTRTEAPRTPYDVRIRTWRWIRKRMDRAEIARIWQEDKVFRRASVAMEELDSAEHATMPQHEKVQAMMRHGRVMCQQVRVAKGKSHEDTV